MDPMLLIEDAAPRVARGGEGRVAVTVHNPGDDADHYRFEVLGDAGRWARVEPRHLSDVPAGGQAAAELLLRPPPDAPAGTTPFAVRGVSLRDATRCGLAEGEVTVRGSRDVEVSTAVVAARGRRSGRYLVRVRNQGRATASVRLSAADPGHELGFALAPAELTVDAGDTATAYLSVRPRRPKLAGRAVPHRFTVAHRGDSGAPDRESVRFEQRPVLGAAGATAALLAAVALLVGAGFLARPSVRDLLPGAEAPTASSSGAAPSAEAGTLSGFYVLWGTTFVDDTASQGEPERLLAALRAAGVDARILDSRTTPQLAGLSRAAFVVVSDGFPDGGQAQAVCAGHRDTAPNCSVVESG
ncbi:hypothetical protein [Geodermatophilus ruber]|uniref:Uncharacterized protein n=1 Tax=Geodermatophilus ruber TaxID=504800 RepID=A0A1I4BJL9_9ACTN|nr:hypothetical protein [Geodermatophilus ruber]SFK68713.1 hypothetical protein SAMN04488085_10363 [Geodermatophilus ruber]